MLDNIPIGIVLGLAIGAGFAETNNDPATKEGIHKNRSNKFLLAIATLILVILYYFIS